MKKINSFLTLLTFLISFIASAQDVTVINHYGDTTGLGNDASFFPSHATQHTLLINYYEPIPGESTGKLEQLIGNALSFYVDQMLTIENKQIILSKRPKMLVKDLNAIVNDGIKYYNYQPLDQFPGFSNSVLNQIELVESLDLTKIGSNTQSDQDQYKYYFVQKELNDLKLLMNLEIGNISNPSLFQISKFTNPGISPSAQEELLNELKNMSENDHLENIELELSDDLKAIISQVDDESPASSKSFDLLYAMIKSNTIRLDSIQQELLKNNNTSQQIQIDELRESIINLLKQSPAVNGNGTIANLPNQITTIFDVGKSGLTQGQQFVLNELIDILAYNPSLKILITGHTDQTGNASSNWVLSKKRAYNVRDFLMNRGIDDNRIIVNYYGEKYATNQPSSDRKVVIEFINF